MRKVELTTTVLICIALVGLTGAFTAGTFFGKSVQPRVNNLVEERDTWKESAEKYRAIASTHEVEVKVPDAKWKWSKIDYLQYDARMDDNLARLKRDLSVYDEDDRLSIEVEVWVAGQWTRWLTGKRNEFTGDSDMYTKAGNWSFDNGNYFDSIKFGRINRTFQGNKEDLVEEFERHLKNDQWGFYVGGAEDNENGTKGWGWARPNAQITFKVKVFKREYVNPEPDIVYVEVAVSEPSDELKRKAREEVERYLGKQRKQLEANK